MTVLPKLPFIYGPHSPFSAGFRRSQSGMKFRFVSAHDRLVLLFESSSGLLLCAVLSISSVVYRPRLNFTAVLPVPKMSNAALIRGDRSFQHGTHSTASKSRAPM